MKKIMIVEDENIIALSYSLALRKASYEVPKAIGTGEEAISRVSELRPDLILMDIKLKGQLCGIETAKKILKEFPVPIIFLSGNSDSATKERAMKINPAGYLNKPINLEEMVKKVMEIVN